jgi:hypothetical protein
LAAALHRAEAGAFALSNDEVLASLRRALRLVDRPLRLSSLPCVDATDVLHAMQAVEAVRNAPHRSLRATKLPARLISEIYSGNDYLIEFTYEPIKSD